MLRPLKILGTCSQLFHKAKILAILKSRNERVKQSFRNKKIDPREKLIAADQILEPLFRNCKLLSWYRFGKREIETLSLDRNAYGRSLLIRLISQVFEFHNKRRLTLTKGFRRFDFELLGRDRRNGQLPLESPYRCRLLTWRCLGYLKINTSSNTDGFKSSKTRTAQVLRKYS